MIGVVLGGADCLFDDLAALDQLYTGPRTVVAVNDSGWAYPDRIDHWVTLHPEKLDDWRARRKGNQDYTTWSRRSDNVDRELGHWGVGSSSLYGVTVLFKEGVHRVVLCGVPMDGRGNINGRKQWAKKEYELHRQGWIYHLERLKGKVKSMSGWTQDLLGAPTEEWLNG